MMVFSSMSWPTRIPRHRPLPHHQHAAGDGDELGQVGGDEEERDASRGEVADELVDLGLGADVDASGGLEEEQHPAVGRQRPGEHQLLLVAATQVHDGLRLGGVAQVERGGVAVEERPLPPRVDVGPEPPAHAPEYVEGDVLPHRHEREDPCVLPVLGDVAEPERQRFPRAADGDGAPLQPDLSRVAGVEAVEGLHQLLAAAPHETGQAQDLSLSQGEADVVEGALAGEVAHLQRDLPARGARALVEALDVAAHHHADDGLLGEGGGLLRSDVAAVAQHRHAVGDLEDLLQPVRDVEDGLALRAKRPDDLEELLHLGPGEGRGGLVHDEDSRRRGGAPWRSPPSGAARR